MFEAIVVPLGPVSLPTAPGSMCGLSLLISPFSKERRSRIRRCALGNHAGRLDREAI